VKSTIFDENYLDIDVEVQILQGAFVEFTHPVTTRTILMEMKNDRSGFLNEEVIIFEVAEYPGGMVVENAEIACSSEKEPQIGIITALKIVQYSNGKPFAHGIIKCTEDSDIRSYFFRTEDYTKLDAGDHVQFEVLHLKREDTHIPVAVRISKCEENVVCLYKVIAQNSRGRIAKDGNMFFIFRKDAREQNIPISREALRGLDAKFPNVRFDIWRNTIECRNFIVNLVQVPTSNEPSTVTNNPDQPSRFPRRATNSDASGREKTTPRKRIPMVSPKKRVPSPEQQFKIKRNTDRKSSKSISNPNTPKLKGKRNSSSRQGSANSKRFQKSSSSQNDSNESTPRQKSAARFQKASAERQQRNKKRREKKGKKETPRKDVPRREKKEKKKHREKMCRGGKRKKRRNTAKIKKRATQKLLRVLVLRKINQGEDGGKPRVKLKKMKI